MNSKLASFWWSSSYLLYLSLSCFVDCCLPYFCNCIVNMSSIFVSQAFLFQIRYFISGMKNRLLGWWLTKGWNSYFVNSINDFPHKNILAFEKWIIVFWLVFWRKPNYPFFLLIYFQYCLNWVTDVTQILWNTSSNSSLKFLRYLDTCI